MSREEWLDAITESLAAVPYGESTEAENRIEAGRLLDWLEPRIRQAERARIATWLRNDEGSHDDPTARAARTFAQMIERGI